MILTAETARAFNLTRVEHANRIERYGRARGRAERMRDHLRGLPGTDAAGGLSFGPERLASMAQALDTCGGWLEFRHYLGAAEMRLTRASFCKLDKLCPLCACRRGAKYLRAYGERIAAVRSASDLIGMMTLTVKDGPDLAERFEHLERSYSRLIKRRHNAHVRDSVSSLACVDGGVSSIEIKRGKGSKLWHPHLHAVVYGASLPDQAALSSEWREITGDSFIVDVRPLHDQAEPDSDLCEVFKYALKFAELDLADNLAAADQLRSRRLVRSFGTLRGVVVPDTLTDEALTDPAWVEMLYRYAGESSYSLVRERLSPSLAAAVAGR